MVVGEESPTAAGYPHTGSVPDPRDVIAFPESGLLPRVILANVTAFAAIAGLG